MVSRRNFLTISVIMAVLFVMFQFTNVVKDTSKDYNTNIYEKDAKSDFTSQNICKVSEKNDASKQRSAVYIGRLQNDGMGTVINTWSLYSKYYMKSYSSIDSYKKIKDSPGILLLNSDYLKWDKDIPFLVDYVAKGGNIIFCNLPDPDIIMEHDELRELLGITAVTAKQTKVSGIHLFDGFLLGGEARYMAVDHEDKKRQDLDLKIPWYVISSGTKTYMSGMFDDSIKVENENMPAIIWRNSIGTSRVFAVNGDYMKDNTGLGILTAMVSEMKDYNLYPVVNAQNLVVVNYPDLSSENDERINQLYSQSLTAMQREILWPGIAAVVEKTNMKLTCILTPQLDYEDGGDPDPEILSFYLKLLRQQQAEAGVSATSLKKLNAFDKLTRDSVFLKTYAPDYSFLSMFVDEPQVGEIADVISSKLHSSIRTIYTGYQKTSPPVGYESTDITRQRATIDSFTHTYSEDIRERSLETALGYSSIMVNMKNVIYPEKDSETWEKLYDEFASNTTTFWKQFTAFSQTTLAETDKKIRNFMAMNYTDERKGDMITLHITDRGDGGCFILQTHGEKIASIHGAGYSRIENDAYLITVNDDTVKIQLESNQNRFYH